MPIGLVRSNLFLEHRTGAHPERPERIDSIHQAIDSSVVLDNLLDLSFEPADTETVSLVHKPSMIDHVLKIAEAGGGHIDADTALSERSAEVALGAVGAGLAATRSVLDGDCARAMCLVRPPGHHATPTRSMGFCLFNNVAIAAETLLEEEGVGKVAVVDFDVHHGNGTQDCFYDREEVFFLSLHQWPHFPGTGLSSEKGTGPGLGSTRNVPLQAGVSRESWFDGFRKGLDAVSNFEPDFLLVSAGFDSHREDPLGDFPLTDEDFGRIGGLLCELAGERGMVSLLEGGYNLEALGRSVRAYLEGHA